MSSIVDLLSRFRFSFVRETDLQDGIEKVLRANHVDFTREVSLSGADRIDFLLGDGTGLEVKVGGSTNDLIRQIHRYAQHECVSSIVVVASRSRLTGLPQAINGKPIRTVNVLAGIR